MSNFGGRESEKTPGRFFFCFGPADRVPLWGRSWGFEGMGEASQFSGRGLRCIRGERLVFDGLDFDLAPGGALLLTGPNGSGKSSLLRLMTGLLKPAAGEIRWQASPITDDPEAHHARLHYVGHADALKPVLTASENLAFWCGLGTAAEPSAVRRGLEAMGIATLADLPCRFLSAGQKRRVGLARLAARPATLWLLDEPTTALDQDATDRLRGLIGAHRAGGGMVVAATHADLGLADARVLNVTKARPA
jgi:heme exporter protein A